MATKSFLEKNRIIQYIKANDMLKEGDAVVLGLSGGPDSVCLFFVLKELQKEIGFNFSALHVNHSIRGEEAGRDQSFSESLCQKNGVECLSVVVDAPSYSKANGVSMEEAARILRYDALKNAAGAAGKIAVAHNLDDNVETVLFHMARGCGLDGACGIMPVTGQIIRPLLCVKKADILAFLEEEHIEYVVDSTNADTAYSRNYIRHNLIGGLSAINDKALEHIGSMAGDLLLAKNFVDRQANELMERALIEGKLKKGVLLEADEYLRARVVKKYLSSHMPFEKDVSHKHIDQVMELISMDGENYADLPYQKRAVCDYNYLYVRSDRAKHDDVSYEITHLDKFEIDEIPTKTYTKWFDYGKIKGGVVVRKRMPGDYVVINSEGQKKSLKDYMIDAKIPKSVRDDIPLVCDGNNVLWVVGYRMGESAKVDESTKRVVEISFSLGEERWQTL